MSYLRPEQVRFENADFGDSRVVELLRTHMHVATSETARGSGHALDLSGLQARDVTLWTAWENDTLLGCGALKNLSVDHGEIKCMHTVQPHRRRGVGDLVLKRVIQAALERGLKRVSLQTSTWDFFKPALSLYKSNGFDECLPFGSYGIDPNSIFLTRYFDG